MGSWQGGEARDAIGWELAGQQRGPGQREGWMSTGQRGRGLAMGVGPHHGSDFRNLPPKCLPTADSHGKRMRWD